MPMPVTSPTIACSLAAGSYADRLAWIAALNDRALLASRREGRSLVLTYRPDAAADVSRLVQRERECCPFLTFDLAESDGGIVLAITAPPEAEAMRDDVFAPFEQGAPCGCASSDETACAPHAASGPRPRLALAAAGFSALALSCGVCCVVPFVAPAVAAGAIGTALAFTAGLHGVATVLAAVAVIAAWTSIALRRSRSVSRGELVMTVAATVILITAVSWPGIEHWITG